MDSPTETLEEWAAQKALELNAQGWQEAERVAADPDGDLDSIVRSAALLAHRNGVVSLLGLEHRAGILGEQDLRATPGFEWMRDLGIVDEDCERTDLGRECARVLRGEGRDNG